MTPPLSHPDGRLRALIEKWREHARVNEKTPEWYPRIAEDLKAMSLGQGFARNECADELEALLAAVPVEEVDDRSVLSHFNDARDLNPAASPSPVAGAALQAKADLVRQILHDADTHAVAGAVPAPQKEICICAAIQMDNGVILRGHRHDDCFNTAQKYGYKERTTQAKQGFVTSRNRFVGREEGAQLQQAAGIASAMTGKFTDLLFSEDLYFNDAAPPRSEQDEIPRKYTAAERANVRDAERAVIAGQDETQGKA